MLRNPRTSSNNCVIHVPSRSRVFPGFSRRFPEFADFSKIFPETTQPRLVPTTLVSLWVTITVDIFKHIIIGYYCDEFARYSISEFSLHITYINHWATNIDHTVIILYRTILLFDIIFVVYCYSSIVVVITMSRYDFDDEMWLVLPVGNNNMIIIICLEFMAVVRVSIQRLLYFPRFGKTPVIL